MNTENYEKYKSIFGDEWAVFTGTPGKLRKAVFTINKSEESVFLKVPLTDSAKEIVQLEYKNLIKLNSLHLKNTITPIGKMNGESLQQTDVSIFSKNRTAIFGDAHFLSLQDFLAATMTKKIISQTDFWRTIIENYQIIQSAKKPEKIPIWDELIQNFTDVKNSIDTSDEIATCLAHADLTAWNCYADKQKLYMYDWELAIDDAPVFYDLFHFHIQGNCLLGNQSFEMIHEKLNKTLTDERVKHLILDYTIDVKLYLKLYLLYHVSSSLCWYSEQQDLHMQVQWLTSLWNKYLKLK